MNNEQFSARKAISFGWSHFKQNWTFWIVASMLVGVLGGGGGSSSFDWPSNTDDSTTEVQLDNSMMLDSALETDEAKNTEYSLPKQVLGAAIDNAEDSLPSWLLWLLPLAIPLVVAAIALSIVSIYIGMMVQMGYLQLRLDAARGKELRYQTILSKVDFGLALRFIGVNVLVGLMVFFGLLFFIIPGIYLALRYMFASYVVVDDPSLNWQQALERAAQLSKGKKFKLLGLSLLSFGVVLLGLLAFIVGAYVAAIVVAIAYAYAYTKLLEESGLGEKSHAATVPVPKPPAK